MNKMVFVLGAPDPEMEEIERVVRAQGHEVRYACYGGGRVRPENAYRAVDVDAPMPAELPVVFVECEVAGLKYATVVDHHRPGDSGYNGLPKDYLNSSSLGQVLNLLGLEPTPEQRIIAAADHCPTQAYRGECPGVDPRELARWRTHSRAARRGISPEEMERAIEEAREVLLQAEKIEFAGQSIAWVGDRKGEISEASARFALPFMYAEKKGARKKLGIMGAAPEVIERWMKECGLEDVYGDPIRGYAGGYC